MNDYPNIEERTWTLLNGQVDGELSASEQRELDTLLAGSKEMRAVQAELSELSDYLQKVPDKAPPPYLQNAIISTVRLPVDGSSIKAKRGFSTWLTEHWLGPAFALTAGILLTVGIYETSPDALNPPDTTNMSGTIVMNGAALKGDLLDRVQLGSGNDSAIAELHKAGRDYLVDVQLKSNQSTAFTLGFAENGLEFVGVSSQQNQVEAVAVDQGYVTIESKGQQRFTLMLRSPENNLQADVAPLKIGLSVNQGEPQQSELKIVKR